MSFNWKEESEKSGFAERIPNGRHEVRIEDVFYENKDGPLVSSSGDPQIRVIVRDQRAREAMLTITLSAKAGWVLARMFKAAGQSNVLDELEANGIDPNRFAIPTIGDKYLLGMQFPANISSEPRLDSKGVDTGKENIRVETVVDAAYRPQRFLRPPEPRRGKGEKQTKGTHRPVAEEDIPF